MYGQKTASGTLLLLLLCIYTTAVYGLSSQTRLFQPVRRQVAPSAPEQSATDNPFPPMTPLANPAPAPPDFAATTGPAAAPTITAITTAEESVPPTAQTTPSSSATSLIHITALPPAPSGHSVRQQHASRSFNYRYLAPVFAALGVLLGVITAWLLLICRPCRRRKSRLDTLEPGPEYSAPPENMEKASGKSTRRNPLSTFLGGRNRGQEGGLHDVNQSWVARVFSSNRKPPRRTRPPYTNAIYVNGSYTFLDHTDDPFLIPTPSVTTGASNQSSSNQSSYADGVGRSQAYLTTSFLSPGVIESPDERWNDISDSGMRRGIVRGVTDQSKAGPKSRRGHVRVDSDGNVYEGTTSPVPMTPNANNYIHGSQDLNTGLSHPMDVPAMTHGNGFRVVDEDPQTQASQRSSGWTWTLPWVTVEKTSRDKFTAFPSRNAADKRKIPTENPDDPRVLLPSSPQALDVSTPRPTHLPRADSSVLPSSPPRVHSPPLEAQLFFSPLFGSTPSLTLAVDKRQKSQERHLGVGQLNDVSSRLPFPAADVEQSTPYRRRLTKSPPVATSATDQARAAASDGLQRTTTSVSAASTVSRQIALDKVDQILAKSWSQREMAGIASPVSPTMFGAGSASGADAAVLIRSPEETMGGIEERLAQV